MSSVTVAYKNWRRALLRGMTSKQICLWNEFKKIGRFLIIIELCHRSATLQGMFLQKSFQGKEVTIRASQPTKGLVKNWDCSIYHEKMTLKDNVF